MLCEQLEFSACSADVSSCSWRWYEYSVWIIMHHLVLVFFFFFHCWLKPVYEGEGYNFSAQEFRDWLWFLSPFGKHVFQTTLEANMKLFSLIIICPHFVLITNWHELKGDRQPLYYCLRCRVIFLSLYNQNDSAHCSTPHLTFVGTADLQQK